MGVRLFERLPTGYCMTAAGEEMLRSAERMEREANDVDRRLQGSDARLTGEIRITMPAAFATHLLMPEIAAFRRAYTDIRLDILTANAMADLAQREADVAIRMSNNPPDDLVGRRVLKMAAAGYVSADHLPGADSKVVLSDLNWLAWSDDPRTRQWIRDSDYPDVPVGAVINDPLVALEAARAGLGMAMLPCFLGDPTPDLHRMPPGNLKLRTDLWVLTHADLSKTARIRRFTTFITEAILRHRNRLEGKTRDYD